ncbi:kinase-like domain-containing protein [Fusarium solani]|uniref:Kinase-like domain-containing protein n=1 Tax=Fusarium solani TaxID=169388 RepID=A0A9P9L7K6_FUSSL|nr:kinase-like domain-containing protein [Fusarium solani]KAH7275698.1 kinase-like domain-containing protein [Fusarium solani]
MLEDESLPMKQFSAGFRRRLSGKLAPSQLPNGSSRSSYSESPSPAHHAEDSGPTSHPTSHPHSHRRQYYSEKLLAQVGDWLEHERTKAAGRKSKKTTRRRKSKSPPKAKGSETASASGKEAERSQGSDQEQNGRSRSDSIDSDSSDVSFDRLQRILEDSMAHMGFTAVPHFPPKLTRPKNRKVPSRASLRGASSDTDYVDGDAIVPSCDAWLDNSKTMSYAGGGSTEDLAATNGSDDKVEKERENWLNFKNEIIRIAHTLRLKGWRRIPLGGGDKISVERLSGALTNAVYVVHPPRNLDEVEGKRMPSKLLLRIYGPQVEHLIDRDNELQVLQRLARKRIGPRLLGTFQNGRFEQFFDSITLTPSDLRDPEMSKQIAKRMRELHEGIELLPHERENGPATWRSWDQWLDNVERIATFLDKELEKEAKPPTEPRNPIVHAWKSRGYVCGTPWPQFKEMIAKYRAHLYNHYKGGQREVKDKIVFAHSDTQYGNILRIRPDDEKSPLLQPANQHKQLIVIDFEYAGPNTRGLEFANHFNEWTYNYHDAAAPWACNERRYPTPDEQRRFVRAYVDHRPRFQGNGSTPRLAPSDGNLSSGTSTPIATPLSTPSNPPASSSSSIVEFMLDARVPPGGWSAAERANEEERDQRVRALLEETQWWRPANHAHWIAWGIVQAKIPVLDDAVKEEDLGPDEFDYLSYAQDRVMFFWGDCVQMGLVKKEELPELLQKRLKIVEY